MEKVWEWIKSLFASVFSKESLIDFCFRALEVIFAGLLAIGIFLVVYIWFTLYTAIAAVGIVFYFFSPTIKPYFDKARKFIISKATGIDVA